MLLNISSKPQSSLGFMSIKPKTYKALLANQSQSIGELKTRDGCFYVVTLLDSMQANGKHFVLANQRGEMLTAFAYTVAQARKKIREMLNLNEVLRPYTPRGRSREIIAVVTEEMPERFESPINLLERILGKADKKQA